MLSLSLLLSSVALVLGPTASLAQSPQEDWTFPRSPDYTSTLIAGRTYTISWTPALRNAFDTYCSSCDVRDLDLLVTGAASSAVHSVGGIKPPKLVSIVAVARDLIHLAEGINIVSDLSYEWTVDIPLSDLDGTSEWVFRFVPAGSTSSFQQVSSSIFYVRQTDEDTTSNPSSSAATGEPTASSAELTPAPTSTTPTPATEGRSKAWIAGPVVGSVAGAALIASAGVFFWRRKRAQRGQKLEVAQLHSESISYELENSERRKPVELENP